MSDKFVLPLKPVNHFSRLPNQKLVSQFISAIKQKLKQKLQQIEPRCCFLVAQSEIDAFFIVCFCFGKLALMDQLSKNEQISQQTIQYFCQSMQNYEWNKTAFQIFQLNSEQFGKTYPRYFQQILSKYKSKREQVELMFKKIIQNDLLYNVKIRIWDQSKQERYQLKQYKRSQEQNQIYHSCNLVYLLITIDGQNNNYNVGMLEMKKKIDVRDTFMTISNQQQQEQTRLKQKSEEKQIQNQMDLNKRPVIQQKPEKLRTGCKICQIF